MSTVIVFPLDRARQQGEFEACCEGNCPQCRRAPSAMLNVHKSHFCVCETCCVCWRIGINLFSSWRHETEADWQRNADFLESCREVEPLNLWRPEPLTPLPAWVNTFEAACRYLDEFSGTRSSPQIVGLDPPAPPDDAA